MFCTKCGNEVAEGSAFCSRCCNPLGQSSPPAVGSTTFIGAASDSVPAGAAVAMKKPVLPIAAAVIVIAVIVVVVVTGGFSLLGSVSPKDTVEEYTWKELSTISSKIAEAADENEVLEIAKKYNLVNEDGTLDGTQTKSVTLTDGTETSVQIAGFAHDDKSDGSGKAGITFIFVDAIVRKSMNSDGSSDGGWESCSLRSWLSSTGKAWLPEELQDLIVAVDKSTNNEGKAAEGASSVTITSDELWLFSYVEVAGELDKSAFSYADIYNAEGSQYKLFSDCGVNIYSYSYDILAKTYQGDSYFWWGRSPLPEYSGIFMIVNSGGGPHNGAPASDLRAVVPGFCI